jgi:uncharacterized membrane protein YgdD (TMEM256/DUF423 family)
MSSNNIGSADFLRKIASFLGASGVALGAIGAHAFKETLTKRGTAASWQTATIYQLFHATAILGLSITAPRTTTTKSIGKGSSSESNMTVLSGQLLSLGTIMFSGSIYCLALGVGPKAILGPTTPFGGLLMIGGWIIVGLS